MKLSQFMASIGQEVQDADDESFLLFSQDIPSSNLGFIDSRSDVIDVTVIGREFTIHQSPTVLNSKRQGGTTGAVLWKITPAFAEWISSKERNVLWTTPFLGPQSTVVELGCGISGLLALSLAPSIGHYIATDQAYVQKLLNENLATNATSKVASPQSHGQGRLQALRNNPRKSTASKRSSSTRSRADEDNITNPIHEPGSILFTPFDWETDDPSTLKSLIRSDNQQPTSTGAGNLPGEALEGDPGFDVLLACDCIYNDALIPPFVRACADICRLRPAYSDVLEDQPDDGFLKPTLCIIAQQLRSHEVFEEWMRSALVDFNVWRVKDEVVGKELGSSSGYVVHILILRDG